MWYILFIWIISLSRYNVYNYVCKLWSYYNLQLDKFDGLESLKEEINKLFEFSKTDSQKQEVLSKMEDMSEQLKVHSKMLQSLLDDQESGMSKTNQVWFSICWNVV